MHDIGNIVLATDATTVGGVWRHILDLARGLRKAGVKVSIELPAGAEMLKERAERANFSVGERIDSGAVWHLHLANTLNRRIVSRVIAARRRGAAMVVTEHLPRSDATDPSLSVNRPHVGAIQLKSAFKRWQLALFDRVIVVSEGSRNFVCSRYGLDVGSVHVVHNGVEEAGGCSKDRVSVKPSGLRFVAAGAVIRQKGLDVLVEAAERASAGWTVDVFGDGPHLAALRLKARRSGRVIFHGWRDDVSEYLQTASALVMPSRWEAFPYSALEAMACGLPVIGTNVDGLSEIVQHGRSGLLCPADDVDALASALDSACRSPAALAEWGAAAVAGSARYSVDAMVKRTQLVYVDALIGRGYCGHEEAE